MAIYKMVGDKEWLDKVALTSFGQEGVLERSDIQRMLREQPEVLEEGLFIITEEFSNWEGSGRSIDLLGLDATGRLVVIELKRGETGEHMDLQAIRYAAMVSTITLQQAIEAHRSYLNKLDKEGDAEELVKEHLENPKCKGFSAERPRIVLLSEGFSPELTTCALWLNESGLDVTCIRMQPHRSGTELLVETSQVIPLPEAQDYFIKVRAREEEQAKGNQAGQGQYTMGGEAFKEQIEAAPKEAQSQLEKLHTWALGLEANSLAVLSTYTNDERCNLLIGIPKGNNPCLIRVIMSLSAITFSPVHYKQYAPKSIPRLKELFDIDILARNSSFRLKLETVDERLLSSLHDAYVEANGIAVGNNAPDR